MSSTIDHEYQNSNGLPNTNGRYHGENPIETGNRSSGSIDDIDIRQIIALVFHNKWLILSITTSFTVLATVGSFFITPIFESAGTIIISTATSRYAMSGGDLSSLLMSSYGIGAGSSVDSELEILNSRTLARDLASRILIEKFDAEGRLYPLLWLDYPKDSTLVTIDAVTKRIMKGKLIEQKNGKVSSILEIKFQSPSPLEAMRLVNLIIETYSETSTNSNRMQAKAALGFLSTELENVKDQVGLKEEELRTFMNNTKLIQLDSQTKELIETLSKLVSERKSLDVRLTSVNGSSLKYQEEIDKMVPGLSRQLTSSLAPVLQRLQLQLAEFETEKVLLIAKNPAVETSPESLPRYVQLEYQIRILREEMAKASKELLENDNYQFLGFLGSSDGGIANKIQGLKSNLFNLEMERTQIEAQSSMLGKQIAEFEEVFDNLPDNMIQLARLRRDLLINEQLYLALAKQLAETSLWEQTQSGLARIVDTAIMPENPVEPKKKIIVLFGFSLSFVFSLVVVFVRELSKKEIDSVEKLRKKGYPILSVIPDLNPYVMEHFDGKLTVDVNGQKISTGLITLLDSISPISESYRRLQSNILYSKPDNPYKVILTTSSNKSEGKTTLSANLAITMAETGKRVLIIDCDFRRPRIHSVFGVAASPGLVDLLFDNSEPDKFINNTVIENVFVLTAGNRPPNPAEINRSEKLKNLISKLRYDFDFIIIDTPPYGIITDAAPLIKMADGVVLVAKFNQTKNGELDHTIDSLKRINANVIGTALTAFDSRKMSGYHYTDYYYQYSYESYKEYDNRS